MIVSLPHCVIVEISVIDMQFLSCCLRQIVVWRFLNRAEDSDVLGTKKALVFIVFLQYIPRFVRFIPLTSDLKKSQGVFAETAWAGAAYYLLWFILASHVSNWYPPTAEYIFKCRSSEEHLVLYHNTIIRSIIEALISSSRSSLITINGITGSWGLMVSIRNWTQRYVLGYSMQRKSRM